MEVGIHANMCDNKTQNIMKMIQPSIRELSKKLTGEYGGLMEHLWIDIELVESHCKEDGSARFPFRFQKRVSGKAPFGLPPQPDNYNVGHFSVRPDFSYIKQLNEDEITNYFIKLVYKSLDLLKNKKQLSGFNLDMFKNKYLETCKELRIICD